MTFLLNRYIAVIAIFLTATNCERKLIKHISPNFTEVELASLSDNSASCVPNPTTLSPLAKAVFDVIQTSESLDNSPVPRTLLLTQCNELVSVLVDGPQIFQAFKEEISRAKYEVDMVFKQWEDDSDAAVLIGEGLKAAVDNHVGIGQLLVRILVNDEKLDLWDIRGRPINDLFDSAKEWNLDKEKVNLQFATYTTSALGVLHEKFLVVDGTVLIVTGASAQKVHNASPPRPWHDTGYLIKGRAALSALSSFDDSWNSHAKHWECKRRSLFNDCQSTNHDIPSRWWLQLITPGQGSTSVIAVGRKAKGEKNNNTKNPQDLAWLTAMNNAQNNIHILTPNINDDDFQRAVTKAAGRGVEVKLITSKGFNKDKENLPGQGGFNREVIGQLRQRMRNHYPGQSQNLKICWFSKNGIRPIVGNDRGNGANHAKFMSIDGQIAIVGSGNMDTQSWNQSREFNILIDGQEEVSLIERSFFQNDCRNAVCSLVELYEGNNATQKLVCSESALQNQSINFTRNEHCDNDEARSLMLHDVRAGRVIRLFDDSQGKTDDDWLEIIVKRNISERIIRTFERSLEDNDVKAIFHGNGNLDGKVSRLETSSTPTGPLVDLYKGNNATDDIVCSIKVGQNRSINFTNNNECDSDAARSLRMFDVPAGRVIRLFDNSEGKTDDDWLEIIVKRNILDKIIKTFERSFEDSDVKAIFHGNGNLDGKVSRLETSSTPTGPLVDLYKGNKAKGDIVCSIKVGQNRSINFTNNNECDSDAARSLRMFDVPAGKALLLYDNSSGDMNDDWTIITTKSHVLEKLIPSFETSFEDNQVRVMYFRRDNLDGKVSRFEFKDAAGLEQFATLEWWEDKDFAGKKHTRILSSAQHNICLKLRHNDEMKSLKFYAHPGWRLRIYDNGDCERNDDWAEVTFPNNPNVEVVAVPKIGQRGEDEVVPPGHYDLHLDDGIVGKVSAIKILIY